MFVRKIIKYASCIHFSSFDIYYVYKRFFCLKNVILNISRIANIPRTSYKYILDIQFSNILTHIYEYIIVSYEYIYLLVFWSYICLAYIYIVICLLFLWIFMLKFSKFVDTFMTFFS